MFNHIEDALQYIESKRTKRTFLMFQETIKKYHFHTHQKNMIHVAGTNGKGSTTVFIRDLLMKHGYHVGTFTSPYIVNHNERICIDGKPISDDDLLKIINEFYDMIENEQLSMFEIDTLIMLKYFDEHDLDFRIIECGIGGLNDKTNVINSVASVITNIGYDHQFMLGNTLTDIAYHKAGIIKEGTILLTTENHQNILTYFQKQCRKKKSQFQHICVPLIKEYPYKFFFKNHEYVLKNCGHYQVSNALLALHVASYFIDLDQKQIQNVFDEFFWPGRFEKIGEIYLDGAHNVNGIQSLMQTIDDQNMRDVGIVFSALNDKDISQMLDLLKNYDVILASFDDERSQHQGINYQQAISLMKKKHRYVVVTGSLHFIATVRKYLKTLDS